MLRLSRAWRKLATPTPPRPPVPPTPPVPPVPPAPPGRTGGDDGDGRGGTERGPMGSLAAGVGLLALGAAAALLYAPGNDDIPPQGRK
jgi:hypothetical protein